MLPSMARFKPPGQCPVCGEWIPKGQAACDECGACEKSGWKNTDSSPTYDGLDLPDDEFDYDDFVAREFGSAKPKGTVSGNQQSLWFWVGIALVAAILLGYLMPLLRGR
jgi:hypothetical protein